MNHWYHRRITDSLTSGGHTRMHLHRLQGSFPTSLSPSSDQCLSAWTCGHGAVVLRSVLIGPQSPVLRLLRCHLQHCPRLCQRNNNRDAFCKRGPQQDGISGFATAIWRKSCSHSKSALTWVFSTLHPTKSNLFPFLLVVFLFDGDVKFNTASYEDVVRVYLPAIDSTHTLPKFTEEKILYPLNTLWLP